MISIRFFAKLFLFTLFFLCSCHDDSTLITSAPEIIKIDIEKEPVPVDFNDYFSSSKIIQLEANENSIFSNIDRLILNKNKIFIFSKASKAVFVFNNEGRFLFKINNLGRGPDEYQWPTDFSIDDKNNRILLCTFQPMAVFVYNMDGVFIEKIDLDNPYANLVAMDHKMILLNFDSRKKQFLAEYNLDDKSEKGFMDFNEIDDIYGQQRLSNPYLTKDKNIHFVLPYSNTVYEYKEDIIIPKYVIDFGSRKMPNTIHKELNDLGKMMAYGDENNYGYGLCEFRENKNYITLTYMFGKKTLIYSKKTKTSIHVKGIVENEYMFYGQYIAYNGNDNKYVLFKTARNFKVEMNRNKANDTWSKVPDQLKQIDSSLTDYDNPILYIYTFKE